MIQVALLVYGFLGTFVLSGSARNRREGRSNPPIMNYVSWALTGVTIGLFAGVLLYSAMDWPMDLSGLGIEASAA